MNKPSKDQLQKLASKLEGGRSNIYFTAPSILGYKPGEEIFDQLDQELKFFKCDLCDLWQYRDGNEIHDVCGECLDEGDNDE